MGKVNFVIRPGGSSDGYSTWAVRAACPKKAALSIEARGDSEPWVSGPTGVGTLYHAFKEMHLLGTLPEDVEDVVFVTEDGLPYSHIDMGARIEAERLIEWWRENKEDNFYGEVLATELVLEDHEGLAGFPTLTGIIDAVVRLNEEDCERLNAIWFGRKKNAETGGWQLDLVPGVYLVDHKSHGKRFRDWKDKYENSLQFIGYQKLYNLNHEEPCAGALASVVFKLREPDHWMIQMSALADAPELEAAWDGAVRFITAQLPVIEQGLANPFACYEPYMCKFLLDGTCQRK